MHIIVTGGAGFIGSHLTEALLDRGHQVTVVDNLRTGSLKHLPCHPSLLVIQKDIQQCQPEDFASPVDGIAHLAATPSVGESWSDPVHAHHNNLSTTIAVINLCQALAIPKLVFASSAAVYGNLSTGLIAEDNLTTPISPYGLQKLTSEQYASLYADRCGFAFVGLRLFNVFGPRQAPNSAYSGVISRFSQALQQGSRITVYGNGSQTRDFIYVKDVAQAFVQALEIDRAIGTSLICNIGTGVSISLLQLLEHLREIYPETCLVNGHNIQFAASRPGDIQHSQANVALAQSTLKFHSRWSIAQGLRSLADPSQVSPLFPIDAALSRSAS